jgi:transcriptional regulator with XRE-family HTH domain
LITKNEPRMVAASFDFRARLRAMLERSGYSMRQLSAAFGRDPGYVAALLDPSRPPRARPTPADLVAAADATGIPLVDWLAEMWAVDPARLAAELASLGLTASLDQRLDRLRPAERRLVLELIDSLARKPDAKGNRTR